MRLRVAGLVLFLLLFLLALLLQWPAAWLAPWLDSASAGQWRLAAAQGTLWNGNGMLLTRAGANEPWRGVQGIAWQWRWNELLAGQLRIRASLERGAAQIVVAPSGIAVEQLDTTLPAEALAGLLPGALGRYHWHGLLQARSAVYRCDWRARMCSGRIEMLWTDAAVSEVSGPVLGDYRIELNAEGNALRLDLATVRGRLQINGHGEFSAGALRFNGEAAASGANGDNAGLNSLLNALGRPTGVAGKYLLDYRS